MPTVEEFSTIYSVPDYSQKLNLAQTVALTNYLNHGFLEAPVAYSDTDNMFTNFHWTSSVLGGYRAIVQWSNQEGIADLIHSVSIPVRCIQD